MKLKDFIKKKGLKIIFVSDLLGINRNTLTHISAGVAVSEEVANKVREWSGGVVHVNSLPAFKGHVRNRRKNFPQST